MLLIFRLIRLVLILRARYSMKMAGMYQVKLLSTYASPLFPFDICLIRFQLVDRFALVLGIFVHALFSITPSNHIFLKQPRSPVSLKNPGGLKMMPD